MQSLGLSQYDPLKLHRLGSCQRRHAVHGKPAPHKLAVTSPARSNAFGLPIRLGQHRGQLTSIREVRSSRHSRVAESARVLVDTPPLSGILHGSGNQHQVCQWHLLQRCHQWHPCQRRCQRHIPQRRCQRHGCARQHRHNQPQGCCRRRGGLPRPLRCWAARDVCSGAPH